MRVGDILGVRPTGMAAGGDALARTEDGRVVFVTGALPEESVAVAITQVRRDFARAEVVDILESSPHRVEPACPHLARGCGGCPWMHITPDHQRTLRRDVVVDAFRRVGRFADAPVRDTVALPEGTRRTTVRAAVVGSRAGYRQGGGHGVVTTESCGAAHPLLEDLLARGRFPGAREVVLRCGARTGQRLAAPRPSTVAMDVPDDVRSDHVEELAAGRRFRISAASFFQPSPEAADALVALVLDAAGSETAGHAVDLYSGVGLFAGALADRGWAVTAVEGSNAAVDDARRNLAGTDVDVVHADVTAWDPVAADVVVADPSRAGLGRAGVDVVTDTGASRVVLISCDVAAAARDSRLLADGGYALTSVTPVDLFPDTAHVEVVTILDQERLDLQPGPPR